MSLRNPPHWMVWFIAMLAWMVADAAIITNAWVPVFKGVDYTTAEADASEVRQQKVFAFRVDLLEPSVEFFSTPDNGAAALETFGQATTVFVNTYGVAVGINANFFSPVNTVANDPRELSGLAISRGQIVSPFESGRPSLVITRANQAALITAAQSSYTNFWAAVAGSDRILINGVPQKATCTTDFCNQNPRSAVGISSNGRYLCLMVIDGRQTGWSDGATLYETGQWLLRLGAWNGLNLDGGGSTALAKMESGTAVLLNRPSGGTQRVNGNHLGLFAAAIAPVIASQPEDRQIGLGQSATFTVKAGGTTPLRYQWRLNGANIASATGSAYTRSGAQLAQFGRYSVVVTNASGMATSAEAMLIMTNPPAPPRFTSYAMLSNGAVHVTYSADQGRMYSLETSWNLVTWLKVTNVFSLQPKGFFTDEQAGVGKARFYRLRWPSD